VAEVVARSAFSRVVDQLVVEEIGVEHVDAHAAEAAARPSRHGARQLRLLLEAEHAELLVDLHHAQLARGFLDRHLDAAHRHVGAAIDVLVEHARVIHLVDVVAGEHQDQARIVAAHDSRFW
jgi:hypothetical protein